MDKSKAYNTNRFPTLSERQFLRLLNVTSLIVPPISVLAFQPLFVADVVANLGLDIDAVGKGHASAPVQKFQKPTGLPWGPGVAYSIYKSGGRRNIYAAWKISASYIFGLLVTGNVTSQVIYKACNLFGIPTGPVGGIEIISQTLAIMAMSPVHFTETIDIWNQMNNSPRKSIMRNSLDFCSDPTLMTLTVLEAVVPNLLLIAQTVLLPPIPFSSESGSPWPWIAQRIVSNFGVFLLTNPISVFRRRLELHAYLAKMDYDSLAEKEVSVTPLRLRDLRSVLFAGEAQASWSGLFRSLYPIWDSVIMKTLIEIFSGLQFDLDVQ